MVTVNHEERVFKVVEFFGEARLAELRTRHMNVLNELVGQLIEHGSLSSDVFCKTYCEEMIFKALPKGDAQYVVNDADIMSAIIDRFEGEHVKGGLLEPEHVREIYGDMLPEVLKAVAQ